MNPELTELLRANGWIISLDYPGGSYALARPMSDSDDTATAAPDLLNLLRLGGYKAHPNRRTDPTRIYIPHEPLNP